MKGIGIKRVFCFLVLFIVAGAIHLAHAVLYEWIDENGVKHFSTQAPPPQSKAKIKAEIDSNSAVHRFADFIRIEAGSFTIGSPPDEKGRDPALESQRKVTIPKDFYIMQTEVTREMWIQVMGYKNWRIGPGNWDFYKHDEWPATGQKISLIKQFIQQLNTEAGAELYRLPTSEEWEYACRAGSTSPFYTGNCLSSKQANIKTGFSTYGDCPIEEPRRSELKPVASYPPNIWGLFDMHGNAAEICSVAGPAEKTSYIAKGGSYQLAAGDCRSAAIGSFSQNAPVWDIGFRLVKTIP